MQHYTMSKEIFKERKTIADKGWVKIKPKDITILEFMESIDFKDNRKQEDFHKKYIDAIARNTKGIGTPVKDLIEPININYEIKFNPRFILKRKKSKIKNRKKIISEFKSEWDKLIKPIIDLK